MSDGLEQDVLKAVEEHLPAQIGNVLRKRLEEAEGLKARLEDSEAKRIDIKKNMDQFIAENDELKELKNTRAALDQKDRELTDREKACEHREKCCEIREAHATEKVTLVRGVVQDVFRNNVIKTSVYGGRDVPDGRPGYEGMSSRVNHDETTEVEG